MSGSNLVRPAVLRVGRKFCLSRRQRCKPVSCSLLRRATGAKTHSAPVTVIVPLCRQLRLTFEEAC